MFETIVLLAQIISVGAIAAWLTTGVWDNIMHPLNNEQFTAEVMTLARMKDEYPEQYARVANRVIEDRSTQLLAFRFVVLVELIATIVLWLGVAGLIFAFFGGIEVSTGKAIALLGAMLFTSVWAGFLVVGNYFCYWFCHEEGQNTHYQMTLWGMANMIFLVAA